MLLFFDLYPNFLSRRPTCAGASNPSYTVLLPQIGLMITLNIPLYTYSITLLKQGGRVILPGKEHQMTFPYLTVLKRDTPEL